MRVAGKDVSEHRKREIEKAEKRRFEVDENGTINELFEDGGGEVDAEAQLWGKNPSRTRALMDLWYGELRETVEKEESQERRDSLAFMLTTNSVIDMIMDALPEDLAMELSYCLDSTIGLALANKQYGVDLIEEEKKALELVKREDYDTDDDFARAVEAIDDHWWSIGQPALEKRSPNDVIIEALAKYKLNE